MCSYSNRFDRYPIKQLFLGITIIAGTLLPAFATSVPARTFGAVDDNDTVTLQKNVPPLARPEFDKGATEASLPMGQMILTLRLTPQKNAALESFLADRHDPASPDFHRWLTPEEFKERFGPSSDDMSHGFSIGASVSDSNGTRYLEEKI